MIQFQEVSKCYQAGQDVLSEVSFQLAKAEMAFLTGHSGAGKSTLLKLIMAIEKADHGRVMVNNQGVTRCRGNKLARLRRHIGFIFQEPHLLSDRNVFDNIAMPLVIAGFSHHEIAKRVRAALDKVSLLGKEKRYPNELSGGEQQRVSIARAVVNKPPVLLADEPTGNLDPNLSSEIMHLLSQFNQVGVTVLIASHDIALIKQFDYRILQLHQGRLLDVA